MDYLSEKAKRLTPYVAGLQPQDSGWIKLNTNENPYPPSPKVTEALKKADIDNLRLYPNSDAHILCEAVAETFGIKTENIFAGNGSDEVLALAFQAFFCGKDKVFMPDISYGFYPVWSEIYDVGAKIIPVQDDFSINPGDYKGANGVIIANPNAPTGFALTLTEIEEIVHYNPDGAVIVDEAYIDFADVESAISLIEKYDNLLVVRTFSKAHSLAGLRAGYAVGNEKLVNALQRIKNAFNSYPLDMLAQIGAAAAMRDIDYRNKTREMIIATRNKTAGQLRESDYKLTESQANFMFVGTKDAKALYEYLFAHKILVRYWDKPRISNHLRITIGTDEKMEEFIQCVKQF